MKNTSCAAFLLVAVVINFQTHAGFGTLEEALKAARKKSEPTYLKPLTDFYRLSMNRFAARVKPHTARQKLAFTNSIALLFRLMYRDAIEAAGNAVAQAAPSSSSLDARQFAQNAGARSALAMAQTLLQGALQGTWPARGRRQQTHLSTVERRREVKNMRVRGDEVRREARDAAQREALDAATKALEQGATLEEAGEVAYRVAERFILNSLGDHLEWRLPAVYEEILHVLPEHIAANNPFINVDAYQHFYERHLANLDPAAAMFIAPIEPIVDTWSHTDAPKAAPQRSEPSHLKLIIDFYSRSLHRFVARVQPHTARQKLVFAKSVAALFRLVYKDALDAACNAAAQVTLPVSSLQAHRYVKDAGAQSALGIAQGRLQIALRGAWPELSPRPQTHLSIMERRRDFKALRSVADEVRYEARDVAQREALKAFTNALKDGAPIQEAGEVAYRVAERFILNSLGDHLAWRLPQIYQETLQVMPDHIQPNNPFTNAKTWRRFFETHFANLQSDAAMLIAPLWNIVDSATTLPAALQFQHGLLDPGSPIFRLPREIVVMIVALAVPQFFTRGSRV